jgi:outer membrane receptor protein involved in Fe transport
MADSKIGSKLRLVWGARAEYFKLDTIRNPTSLMTDDNVKLLLEEEKDWRFLPSASATYSPIADVNIRAAYAKSAVRPGLMENSRFSRYNPNYGTRVRSQGVTTTIIDNYDVKAEWFPKPGEVISAGYFYKDFDKPAEFFRIDNESGGGPYVTIGNSESAKVKGWEFEVRKNLGFILPASQMENVFLMGNLTLQKSEVMSREIVYGTDENGKETTTFKYLKYPRQLYGQVPLLYNLGAQYSGKKFGFNVVYNYMGYKTFVTASEPSLSEYERPRGQLDAQVSYKFLKGKMETKLNITNLTDAAHRFFANDESTYEYLPGMENYENRPEYAEWGDLFRYKEGFTEKYQKAYTDKETGRLIGDRDTFTRYVGRTFSLSFSYKF